MPTALVRVTADRTVRVTVDGTTSQHPDVGAAIAHLAGLAREQSRELTVELDDHGSRRTLFLDAAGRLRSAPEAPAGSDHPAPSGPAGKTAGAPVPGRTAGSAEQADGHKAAAAGTPMSATSAAQTGPAQANPTQTGPAQTSTPPTAATASGDGSAPQTPTASGTDPNTPAGHDAAASASTGRTTPTTNGAEPSSETETGAPTASGTDPNAGAAPSEPTAAPSAATEEPSEATAAPAEPTPTTPPEPEAPAGYPVRDRFSGPAEPTGPPTGSVPVQKPAGTADSPAATRPKRGPKRMRSRLQMRGLTVPTLVLAVLLIIALAAYVMPRIIGSPESQSPESIPAAAGAATQQSLSVATGTSPVPGFASSAAWKAKIPADASVTATARGVVVVTGDQLQVLDPATGKLRFETHIDAPPTFAVDTIVAGKPALVWRIGDRASVLFDGETQPIAADLPPGARVSSAGTNVLIKNLDELWTFTPNGPLTELPTPEAGSTPMALDGDELVSAKFSGPLTVTNVKSGKSRQVDLEAPRDDLQIIRWVTAGHGKVVTLWGQPGASTNSGHRIQLVVHSLADGAIASTVSTTTDTVGEADWVRGQGYELAVIGPYLFSMEDGLLIRDGSEANARFSEPRGTIVPAVIDNNPVLVRDDTAWQVRTNLLAVTGEAEGSGSSTGGGSAGLAITRETPDTVTAYRSEQ